MDTKQNMTLEAFMAPKIKPVADTEYIASDRIVDEEGKPIAWILRPISIQTEKEIKGMCIDHNRFNNEKYLDLLIAESVVYPQLGDAELQDSYHVHGKTALLSKMLTGCEYSLLGVKVQEINGLMKRAASIIKDIKN